MSKHENDALTDAAVLSERGGRVTNTGEHLIRQAEYACKQAIDALELHRKQMAAMQARHAAELAAAELLERQLEYVAQVASNTVAHLGFHFE